MLTLVLFSDQTNNKHKQIKVKIHVFITNIMLLFYLIMFNHFSFIDANVKITKMFK